MPLVLIDLGPFLIALGALIVCLLVVAFAKAFFGVTGTLLGKLPVIGGWLDATAHHIEQRITNVFGTAAAKVEGLVGAMWHAQARIIDRIGQEIASHAGLLATLAQFVPGVGVLAHLYGLIQAARSLVTKLAHEVAGVGHSAGLSVRALAHRINTVVLPRIGRLEREYDRIIDKDIAALRTRTKTVEKSLEDVWTYVRSHPWTLVTEAFVGAVAVALSRLGLDWLRCPSLGRLGKRFGCTPWSILEEILAVEILALAATDLCDFAALVQTTADAFSPALMALVDVEDALVGCHGATRPPTLPLPVLRVPSNSLSLQLAA